MKIAISGAQSTGKSTLLRYLKNDRDLVGFEFIDELTRQLAAKGVSINEEGSNFTQIFTITIHAENILKAAVDEKVNVIGLSGLITPSLDEMVHVAKEMERREIDIPLLIGGATTSRIHTAVKIAPNFSGSVIHVLDASRSVPVVSNLLNENGDEKDKFTSSIKNEYIKLRNDYLQKRSEKKFISIEQARENKLKIDWKRTSIKKPNKLGITRLKNFSLNEIKDYEWRNRFLR